MSATQVFHVRSAPAGAVFIGRPSPFGNPFHLPAHPSPEQRLAIIARYRRWLWAQLQASPAFASAVAALHGQALSCFCAPLPCHGHVLAAAAAWLQSPAAAALLPPAAPAQSRIARSPLLAANRRATCAVCGWLGRPASPCLCQPHLDEQALAQFAAAEALTEQQARADSEADRHAPGAYYAGPRGMIGLWEPEPDPDAKVPQCVECGSQSQAKLSRAGLCQMCVDSWKLYGRVRFTRTPATA